jgi:hypothetical protein
MVGESKVGGRLRKGVETVDFRRGQDKQRCRQSQTGSIFKRAVSDSRNSDFGEKKALQCGNISGVTIGTTIR